MPSLPVWLRFRASVQISVQLSIARAAPQLRNFSTLVATNKHHLPSLPYLPPPHLFTVSCSAAKLLHARLSQDRDLFTQYSDSPVLIFPPVGRSSLLPTTSPQQLSCLLFHFLHSLTTSS